MIPHQPSDALLLDYASGAAAEPVSLLVATHLTLCPESREKVAAYEAIGGMLIEEAKETDSVPDALRDRVLSSLDERDMGSKQVRQAGVDKAQWRLRFLSRCVLIVKRR